MALDFVNFCPGEPRYSRYYLFRPRYHDIGEFPGVGVLVGAAALGTTWQLEDVGMRFNMTQIVNGGTLNFLALDTGSILESLNFLGPGC